MALLYKLRCEIAELKAEIDGPPKRRRLPDERSAVTHKVVISGQDIYITVGEYEDRTLGEIFIRVGKQGAEDAIYDVAANAISLGLQHGIPLQVFINKYRWQRMKIGGTTSDPNIPTCSSIMDYVAQLLEMRYLK